jgi:hypothetical protein
LHAWPSLDPSPVVAELYASFRDPTIVGAKSDAAQAPACRIEWFGQLRAAWSGGGRQIHGLVKPMSFQVY